VALRRKCSSRGRPVSDYGSRVCNYDRSCLNNRKGFDEFCPEHIRQTGWFRPCRTISCKEKCAPGVMLCQEHMDEHAHGPLHGMHKGMTDKEKLRKLQEQCPKVQEQGPKVCVYCGSGNIECFPPGINPIGAPDDLWAHDRENVAAEGCIRELAKRVKALEDAMEGLDASFRAKPTRTLSAILNSSPVGRRAAILATRAKRHEKEDKNHPGS